LTLFIRPDHARTTPPRPLSPDRLPARVHRDVLDGLELVVKHVLPSVRGVPIVPISALTVPLLKNECFMYLILNFMFCLNITFVELKLRGMISFHAPFVSFQHHSDSRNT
jgi:hypothetical protein